MRIWITRPSTRPTSNRIIGAASSTAAPIRCWTVRIIATSGGTPSGASRTPSPVQLETSSWATPPKTPCPAGDAQGQARLHVLPAQVHLLRGVLRFRWVLAGRDHDGNVAEHDGLHAGPGLRVRPDREDDRPGLPRHLQGHADPRLRGARGAPHPNRPRPLFLEHDGRRQLHGQLHRGGRDQHARHRRRPRVPPGRGLLRGLLRRAEGRLVYCLWASGTRPSSCPSRRRATRGTSKLF